LSKPAQTSPTAAAFTDNNCLCSTRLPNSVRHTAQYDLKHRQHHRYRHPPFIQSDQALTFVNLHIPHDQLGRTSLEMAAMLGGGDGALGQLPLEQWFFEMPVCTRWWTTATVITGVLVQCRILTPFQLFYSYRAVFSKSQVGCTYDTTRGGR